MAEGVTNVVVAGLGGQGVLKASDILAEAAFRAGLDVKKAEVHGMSQRGGSVNSDVRFAADLSRLSPMVPAGEADFLLVLAPDQVEHNRPRLRPGGVLICADLIDDRAPQSPHVAIGVPGNLLANKRSLNVAVLGALSVRLDIGEPHWLAAIRANLPEKVHDANEQAFALGREAAKDKA
jgi:indolepyruvate ferredoxin oxidoreductase beta subunit